LAHVADRFGLDFGCSRGRSTGPYWSVDILYRVGNHEHIVGSILLDAGGVINRAPSNSDVDAVIDSLPEPDVCAGLVEVAHSRLELDMACDDLRLAKMEACRLQADPSHTNRITGVGLMADSLAHLRERLVHFASSTDPLEQCIVLMRLASLASIGERF